MMKRIFLGLVLILTVSFVFTGCGQSKKELKTELETIQNHLEYANSELQRLEIENAQLKESTGDSADDYLSAKFYQDGNYYRVLDPDFQFYSDKDCKQSIGNDIRMISPVVDQSQWKDGTMVCVVLSEQGYIYSVFWPNLVVAND